MLSDSGPARCLPSSDKISATRFGGSLALIIPAHVGVVSTPLALLAGISLEADSSHQAPGLFSDIT